MADRPNIVEQIANEIAEAIGRDLAWRPGLGQEWESIDARARDQIPHEWAAIVVTTIRRSMNG